MVSAEEIQKPAAAKARINHPVDDRRRRYELLKRGYELKEFRVELVARDVVPFPVSRQAPRASSTLPGGIRRQAIKAPLSKMPMT